VIFAGGDGWVYSFRADEGQDGKPELLWKFDANPKETQWVLGGRGDRNNIIATPVIYDGLVYVAVGQDPEHGEGVGHLWCIDPTKRGDVSPQLAFAVDGDERQPLPPRRAQAVNVDAGEVTEENPNSAAVWHYTAADRNHDDILDWEEEMHRSLGTVAIKNDLLFIADFSGLFHCVHAKTGEFQWNHDMLAQAWGAPLIVEDHVYIGDEDGDIAVFNLSGDPDVAMKTVDDERLPINATETGEVNNMGNSVYSSPVVANQVLFIASKEHLFAIAADAGADP
jgi:outer membrane protein assembly factor BamB